MNLKKFVPLTLVAIFVLSLIAFPAPTNQTQAQDETFVIGISNSFVGSEWRTQMLDQIEAVAADLEETMNIEIELIVESADTDVQGQIQQVENLINREVDAIIINPGDATGVSLTLEDAVDEGIVVISVDQEVEAFGAINVVIDQKEWAKISTYWLAETLGGEGNIVLIEGFVGHPANEARMEGVEEVLAEYPDIEVVGRESGMWDQATGQQVMSDFLASIPDLDGVWTQDGMATGVLNAILTANPDEYPVMSGEARASFVQQWQALQDEGVAFETIGVVNPPGIGGSGLRVAIEILMGGEVNEELFEGNFENTLYVPIPYAITNTGEAFSEEVDIELIDLATFFEEEEVADLAESFTFDAVIDQETAASFMVSE